MKQSAIFILALLSLTLATMGFRCEKTYYDPTLSYEYSEKLTLTPYKKIYAIGDTIWVQFQTADKTLFDKLSNTRVRTDTTFLYIRLDFYRRYPIGSTVELFSDAKVDNGLDVSFSPLFTYYNVLSFKTDCNNNRYLFQAWFVPKKTGIYSIDPHGDVSACPNKLSTIYTSFTFTFDLADCNKDIWLSIPNITRSGEIGHTDISIDKKEIFVFKVE